MTNAMLFRIQYVVLVCLKFISPSHFLCISKWTKMTWIKTTKHTLRLFRWVCSLFLCFVFFLYCYQVNLLRYLLLLSCLVLMLDISLIFMLAWSAGSKVEFLLIFWKQMIFFWQSNTARLKKSRTERIQSFLDLKMSRYNSWRMMFIVLYTFNSIRVTCIAGIFRVLTEASST